MRVVNSPATRMSTESPHPVVVDELELVKVEE
jgi:hypothetical protein